MSVLKPARWLIRRTGSVEPRWWVVDTTMLYRPEVFPTGAEALAAFARGGR